MVLPDEVVHEVARRAVDGDPSADVQDTEDGEKTDVSSASSSVEGESRVEVRLPEAQVLELFHAALERIAPCPASAAHTCCAGGRWRVKAPMRYDVRVPTDLWRG